jgi:hypothetical protein
VRVYMGLELVIALAVFIFTAFNVDMWAFVG